MDIGQKNIEILVISFDEYSDIWPIFYNVFNKNWSDCPFKVRIVSNEKECEFFETIKTGPETNWSNRFLKALESVETDYILLLLEDYLIGKNVDNHKVFEIVRFLLNQKCKYLRLTNFPKSRFSKKSENIYHIFKDEEYGVNLQASFWNVSYLKGLLEKYSGNAWEFEVGLLAEALKSKHHKMDGCYGLKEDPLNIINGVLKGKWFPSSVRYLKKQNIFINTSQRGKLSNYKLLKYKFIQLIKTHISYKLRRKLKRFLKKVGFKFVSEY